MKLKLGSLFMVLCLTVGLWTALPTTTLAATSGTCGENLTWSVTGSILTITGTGDMADYSSDIRAPWFSAPIAITTVIIDDDVTSIGNYAFY